MILVLMLTEAEQMAGEMAIDRGGKHPVEVLKVNDVDVV